MTLTRRSLLTLMTALTVLAPALGSAQTAPAAATIVAMPSGSAAGTFNSGMIFVAEQLDRNADPGMRVRPTIVTSFVNLNDLGETSALGRLIGENLGHELQVRNWAVADIRLTKSLIINQAGEFSLSRDIRQLRDSYPVSNIVTGTYVATGDGVLINVRIVDSTNGVVISSAQTRLLRDRFVASLVDKPTAAPMVNLTASCPSASICGASR
jgi:TolB-like protein